LRRCDTSGFVVSVMMSCGTLNDFHVPVAMGIMLLFKLGRSDRTAVEQTEI
jgi:hypothetical protein